MRRGRISFTIASLHYFNAIPSVVLHKMNGWLGPIGYVSQLSPTDIRRTIGPQKCNIRRTRIRTLADFWNIRRNRTFLMKVSANPYSWAYFVRAKVDRICFRSDVPSFGTCLTPVSEVLAVTVTWPALSGWTLTVKLVREEMSLSGISLITPVLS